MVSDTEAKEIIGENVRRFRGERTYSELARACSTDDWTCYPATVEQVEKGRHMPGAGLLARLAEVLGVTPNDLLTSRRRKLSKAS